MNGIYFTGWHEEFKELRQFFFVSQLSRNIQVLIIICLCWWNINPQESPSGALCSLWLTWHPERIWFCAWQRCQQRRETGVKGFSLLCWSWLTQFEDFRQIGTKQKSPMCFCPKFQGATLWQDCWQLPLSLPPAHGLWPLYPRAWSLQGCLCYPHTSTGVIQSLSVQLLTLLKLTMTWKALLDQTRIFGNG